MFILITNLQMEEEASRRRNTVLVTEVPTRSPLNVRETTTAAANSLAAGTPGGNHQISNDGRRRQGAGTSSNDDGGCQRPLQISHQTTVNGDDAGPSHQDNSSGCSSALSSLESIKSNSGGGGGGGDSKQKVREKSP